MKREQINISNILDRSDYIPYYKSRKSARDYDSNEIRDFSQEMKSTIDYSNQQSRIGKSAHKFKIVRSTNLNRSSSAVNLASLKSSNMSDNCKAIIISTIKSNSDDIR